MMSTRLWLAGEVSAQRDMPLIRRLMRGCAAVPRTTRFCSVPTDYARITGPSVRPSVIRVSRGHRNAPLGPWRDLCLAQVVKRYAQRRVVDVKRRIVDGTPARVETLRRRSHGTE